MTLDMAVLGPVRAGKAYLQGWAQALLSVLALSPLQLVGLGQSVSSLLCVPCVWQLTPYAVQRDGASPPALHPAAASPNLAPQHFPHSARATMEFPRAILGELSARTLAYGLLNPYTTYTS